MSDRQKEVTLVFKCDVRLENVVVVGDVIHSKSGTKREVMSRGENCFLVKKTLVNGEVSSEEFGFELLNSKGGDVIERVERFRP